MNVAIPAPEVPALRPVAFIAEPVHEPVPQLGDVLVASPSGSLGEPVAGKRRYDDVECGTVDVVGRWIGQQGYEREQFDERAGPAMGEDQR
jgi:hypothetical protein